MSKRSQGLLVGKTRHLARHHRPSTLNTSSIIKEFAVGDKVCIVPKGGMHNIPHPRYKGRTGTVTAKRGAAYVVKVRIMSAERTLIVPSIHLDKAK